MSEKLYKVIEAVDLFNEDNPIPERYLVFEDQDGNTDKVFFPEDRTTLFFKGELYDWYGHKVILSDNIAKILKPFGYIDVGWPNRQTQEKFLVATKDHRLALATLCRHEQTVHCLSGNISILGFKHSLLYNDFISAPVLKCAKWTFREVLDLSSTCFGRHFDPHSEYAVFVDVDSRDVIEKDCPSLEDYQKNPSKGYGFSSIRFARWHTHDHLLKHNFIANREEILSVYNIAGRKGHPGIAYARSNYLLGDLKISKHGEKLTARSPIPDKYGNTRVSTDSEVIKHCHTWGNQLYWYYDPEP